MIFQGIRQIMCIELVEQPEKEKEDSQSLWSPNMILI